LNRKREETGKKVKPTRLRAKPSQALAKEQVLTLTK
jgi:hypothetical protein